MRHFIITFIATNKENKMVMSTDGFSFAKMPSRNKLINMYLKDEVNLGHTSVAVVSICEMKSQADLLNFDQ